EPAGLARLAALGRLNLDGRAGKAGTSSESASQAMPQRLRSPGALSQPARPVRPPPRNLVKAKLLAADDVDPRRRATAPARGGRTRAPGDIALGRSPLPGAGLH